MTATSTTAKTPTHPSPATTPDGPMPYSANKAGDNQQQTAAPALGSRFCPHLPPRLMNRSIATKITETALTYQGPGECVHTAMRDSERREVRKTGKTMASETNPLEAIREKVESGTRLSFDDGLALEASNDLFALGAMADLVRELQRQLRLLQRQHAHQPDQRLRLHLRLLRLPRRPGRSAGLRDGPRADRRAGRRGQRPRRHRAAHRRRAAPQAAVRLLCRRRPLDQRNRPGNPHQGVHGRRDRVVLQDHPQVSRAGLDRAH